MYNNKNQNEQLFKQQLCCRCAIKVYRASVGMQLKWLNAKHVYKQRFMYVARRMRFKYNANANRVLWDETALNQGYGTFT